MDKESIFSIKESENELKDVHEEIKEIIHGPSEFESQFPEIVSFLEKNSLNSLHTTVFDVPLQRFPGDNLGLKLIYSEKLKAHVLTDPDSKEQRHKNISEKSSYYSHYFLLWHLLIHRLFLLESSEKLPTLSDIYEGMEFKSHQVSRLVPQVKVTKRTLKKTDETQLLGDDVKQIETSEISNNIIFLQGNIMTMLPAAKTSNRQIVACVPRNHISAILIDQIYYDTTYHLDKKQDGDKYDWELSRFCLKRLSNAEFFKEILEKKIGDNASMLRKIQEKSLTAEELNEYRLKAIVILLNDASFCESTTLNLIKVINNNHKKRKTMDGERIDRIAEASRDFDFSETFERTTTERDKQNKKAKKTVVIVERSEENKDD